MILEKLGKKGEFFYENSVKVLLVDELNIKWTCFQNHWPDEMGISYSYCKLVQIPS